MTTNNNSSGGVGNRSIKMVVVGDGTVGKSCLLISHTTGCFPKGEYIPTVFENYAETTQIDGVKVNLTLWDTAGQEDYERLRPLCYPGTNVFLLCFSVDSITSYNNVASKWQPEVRHHCPKAAFVLVGTKTDLRNSSDLPNGTRIVTKAMGKKLAHNLKLARYAECSAKTMEGVQEVFEEAIRAVLHPKQNKISRECRLL